VSRELSQTSIRALELCGMSVARLLDRREFADTGIGLTRLPAALPIVRRTNVSRARFSGLAPVGNILR
jgi:hypothetical protein